MKTTTIWMIGIIVVVGLVWAIWPKSDAGPGLYDDFAQCLTDSGAKMYGAYWCPHCANQKETFGNSFKHVDYIECDPRGNDANPVACESAGIQGYPTWIFADGERASGSLTLRELAFRSGCVLE
jgi:hypothetical protein